MKTLRIHLVGGARPNFMKIAPLFHALKQAGSFEIRFVHTGQHYDPEMAGNFIRDLGLPAPDIFLGIGSGSHAEQTGGVMIAYERACGRDRPDWVVVVGDVNSTLACALVARKLDIPLAHLEAGLRCGDRSMPEEINRQLTDRLADLLWTPSPDADQNLVDEGIPASRIERVGNIMIDSFEMLADPIQEARAWERFGLTRGSYGVVTLHRPENVDRPAALRAIARRLAAIVPRLPLLFPVHPRTRARMGEEGIWDEILSLEGLKPIPPQDYVPWMSLVSGARLAITDSGGLQEETTHLHVPCLTWRRNTERPVTLTRGTNRLVGSETIEAAVDDVLSGRWSPGEAIPLWDGKTAVRAVESLKQRAGLA